MPFLFYNVRNIRISNCNFTNTRGAHVVQGGIIWIKGATTVAVEYCIFNDSSSKNKGGALYLLSTVKLHVKECLITSASSGKSTRS